MIIDHIAIGSRCRGDEESLADCQTASSWEECRPGGEEFVTIRCYDPQDSKMPQITPNPPQLTVLRDHGAGGPPAPPVEEGGGGGAGASPPHPTMGAGPVGTSPKLTPAMDLLVQVNFGLL